ncbi:hypothetical protein POM88_016347 [Heracleum sosnowskyi]|uniref:Uncharacterized protein n=1 Tax=Heracleum sosnowskyi TaxID=360622 RepID=A0AAD8INB8_9APIA|nr:hypothetical protein POM88_016347 [Heracleum sosnowskyi]
MQKEIEQLRCNLSNISSTSDDNTQKLKENYLQKLTCLEAHVAKPKRFNYNKRSSKNLSSSDCGRLHVRKKFFRMSYINYRIWWFFVVVFSWRCCLQSPWWFVMVIMLLRANNKVGLCG